MDSKISQFQETVGDYYAKHARELPWRQPEKDGTYNPYHIMVSEIMLQQTQVTRVIDKYQQFIDAFPDVATLAKAPFSEVLKHWNGLGYNRRAKYLHQAAQHIAIMKSFPANIHELEALPGIGKNTAAAICTYAYNQPQVFVETNIRTVYIHHLFKDRSDVSDTEILPLVSQTVDKHNPREWYWALMDYGTHLKKTVGNVSRSSKHYVKQSKFEGSMRQVRSAVLKLLIIGPQSEEQLKKAVQDDRLEKALKSLMNDDMIRKKSGRYMLA